MRDRGRIQRDARFVPESSGSVKIFHPACRVAVADVERTLPRRLPRENRRAGISCVTALSTDAKDRADIDPTSTHRIRGHARRSRSSIDLRWILDRSSISAPCSAAGAIPTRWTSPRSGYADPFAVHVHCGPGAR
jgi:hypothetical protein